MILRLIERRCRCGKPIARSTDDLGCIECGQSCCSACGISLESVVYCAPCARTLLELPYGSRVGVAV